MSYLVGVTFLYSLFRITLAGVRTVIVDDTNGDEMMGGAPFYAPIPWIVGQSCSTCVAQPDPSKVHDGTWHDLSQSEGAHPGQRWVSITFVGHSVSAFFITLGANAPIGTLITNLTFTIDGNPAGTFTSNPTQATDYNYNVLGFSTTSLTNASHKLVISTTGNDSLVLFDYLTYSFDLADRSTESVSAPTGTSPHPSPYSTSTATLATFSASSLNRSSPTHSPSRKGFVTGIIIGRVVACVLAIVVLLPYYLRRKARRNVLRWERIHSIPGTNSTLMGPERVVPQNSQHLQLIANKTTVIGDGLRLDGIDASRVRGVASGGLERVSPRSSVTLHPSDSASNINVHVPPTLDPQNFNELLSIRAKIDASAAKA